MAKSKHAHPVNAAPSPEEPARAIKPFADAAKVTATMVSSHCPSCGSLQREPYHNVRTLDFAGIAPDGRPFTRVVWRRTRCRDCGQARDDKTFE